MKLNEVSWKDTRSRSEVRGKPRVPCSIIHPSQGVETAKVSAGRWMHGSRECGEHHNGILFNFFKKEKYHPVQTTWINLEGFMPSEISQTEKDKYCMVSLTCGILKNTTQLKLKNREWKSGCWSEGKGIERLVKGYKTCSYKMNKAG